jgi:hypothetical protein
VPTVLSLYNKVGAAIFPSTFESLPLRLIEARQAGLSVLASQLDYVRSRPGQTFDPESPGIYCQGGETVHGDGRTVAAVTGCYTIFGINIEKGYAMRVLVIGASCMIGSTVLCDVISYLVLIG